MAMPISQQPVLNKCNASNQQSHTHVVPTHLPVKVAGRPSHQVDLVLGLRQEHPHLAGAVRGQIVLNPAGSKTGGREDAA
jgi:hypothetical protein